MTEPRDESRRRFFKILVTAPIVFGVGTRLPWPDILPGAEAPRAEPGPVKRGLVPTPECGDDDEPTPAETEGPFFKPRSPLRTSLLETGIEGTRIELAGRVFSRDCRPLPHVLVDFWHADRDGDYDNVGFRLRGHQFTDEKGRFRLETVVPGLYPGRTRHFHVKVQASHSPILTTQHYFPGEPRNRRDYLFRPDLLMGVKDGAGRKQARFHFMLDVA